MTSQTTDSKAQPARPRMDYIDALRGAACLWVLLHHSMEGKHVASGWSHLPLRWMVNLANVGWLGVSLFLVLSGFCLYYPLVSRSAVADVRLDLKSFAKRRAWRILPPYYAAILLGVLYILARSYRNQIPLDQFFAGWYDIPAHILMVHNLMPATFASINGVFWSLALEAQLYLVFPLLIVLAARRNVSFILAITFVIAVAWQALVFTRLGISSGWTPTLGTWYHALPGRCFEFVLGMIAASWVVGPVNSTLVRRCALTLAILLVPSFYYVLNVARFGPLIDQAWGVIFACSLVLLHQVPERYFRKFLVLRFLTWTGVFSYSIYLLHRPIFERVPLRGGSDAILILWFVLRVLLVLAISFVFFLMFERPFIKTRRKPADLVEATVMSPAP